MGIELADEMGTGSEWLGAAALDDPGRVPLEELVGLDVAQWVVVGFDVWGGSQGGSFAVFAVQRALVEAAGGDISAASQADGTIPVTRFEMPQATGLELLRALKHWSISARRRGAEGARLSVQDKVELPFPISRYAL
jgi:hypothetical protein